MLNDSFRRSFEWATLHGGDRETLRIVHGLQVSHESDPPSHVTWAWVEWQGWCYCPTTDRRERKWAFYDRLGIDPRHLRRYWLVQAIELVENHGNHGPWHDCPPSHVTAPTAANASEAAAIEAARLPASPRPKVTLYHLTTHAERILKAGVFTVDDETSRGQWAGVSFVEEIQLNGGEDSRGERLLSVRFTAATVDELPSLAGFESGREYLVPWKIANRQGRPQAATLLSGDEADDARARRRLVAAEALASKLEHVSRLIDEIRTKWDRDRLPPMGELCREVEYLSGSLEGMSDGLDLPTEGP